MASVALTYANRAPFAAIVAQLEALSTCHPLTSSPGIPGGTDAVAANERARDCDWAAPGSLAATVEPMLWLREAFWTARVGSVRVTDAAGGAGSACGAGVADGSGVVLGAGEALGGAVTAGEGAPGAGVGVLVGSVAGAATASGAETTTAASMAIPAAAPTSVREMERMRIPRSSSGLAAQTNTRIFPGVHAAPGRPRWIRHFVRVPSTGVDLRRATGGQTCSSLVALRGRYPPTPDRLDTP